jgi:transposase
MPDSGIIVRRTGKYQYVYKVLRTYRNEKGQPTNERKLIGRLNEKGELLPNDNFYHYFQESTADTTLSRGNVETIECIDQVRSIGSSFLVSHILSSLGVDSILKETMGAGRVEEMLTAAAYMVCRGNVMEYIEDWHEGYSLMKSLSPQEVSQLFASITHADRMSFFRNWVARNRGEGYLAYDVTSFSSYAEGIRDAEWGYNRDGEKLPQINMGCYLSQTSGLPLFYVTYPGSIVDKSHMPYMMAYNDELGVSDAVFVMDRGFCSTANVQWLHASGLRYVMGSDVRSKAPRAAIDEARDGIVSLRCRVKDSTYAKSIHSRFYGVSSSMHVYYDPELAERQRSDMFRTVECMGETLAQLGQITDKELRRYARFFDIEKKAGRVFSYTPSYGRIDNAVKNSGYFCVLSNTSLDSAAVLEVYRRKDFIEKGFDDIKNHADMKRLRTHNDATTGGKLFCAFIALIATSRMTEAMKEVNSMPGRRRMSKEALILELEKIKLVSIADRRLIMNPLTRTQRELFAAFGADEEALKSYISLVVCANRAEI